MKFRPIIYGLRDPVTQELKYVGQSSHGLDRPKRLRYGGHCGNWIRSLAKIDLRPVVVILEEISLEDCSIVSRLLDEREIWWIAHAKEQGYRLTNLTEGGGGSRGFKRSKKSNEKCRVSNIGKFSGEKNPMFGKPGTCLGRKGELHPLWMQRGKLCKNSKRVLCRQTNVVFNSLKEAAEFAEVTSTVVSRICKGLQSHVSHSGLSFEFCSENKK